MSGSEEAPMRSGLAIFDGFVLRAALHDCHREMRLRAERWSLQATKVKCTVDGDVRLVR
jgi:hypothetical protein